MGYVLLAADWEGVPRGSTLMGDFPLVPREPGDGRRK